MNSVQLMGNLARDPEVRYTNTGKAVATFTVAASNTYLDSEGQTKEQTAFVNCVAWGKLGEATGNYRKGNRLFVEGRIQTRSYETQDGQKRYVTEVIASFVGVSALNDAEAGSNFDNFADDKGNDENIPF